MTSRDDDPETAFEDMEETRIITVQDMEETRYVSAGEMKLVKRPQSAASSRLVVGLILTICVLTAALVVSYLHQGTPAAPASLPSKSR